MFTCSSLNEQYTRRDTRRHPKETEEIYGSKSRRKRYAYPVTSHLARTVGKNDTLNRTACIPIAITKHTVRAEAAVMAYSR